MRHDELLEALEDRLKSAKRRARSFREAADDADEEVRSLESTIANNKAVTLDHDQFNAAAARLIEGETA
jgi:hypothetical protein